MTTAADLHRESAEAADSAAAEQSTPSAKSQPRLSVNMGTATAVALRELMADNETTATEIVRRAISLLAFVENEKKRGNGFAVLEPGAGDSKHVKEIVLGV